MPKVSIVLPTFNGERFIRDSIDSIIDQTFQDWELIIVDDCSIDNTLEIARKYEKENNRIRVIHNEMNQKLPGALNIGFKHANGRYLTWTSDDNMYLPNALDVMVRYLEDSDAPMVCADRYTIDESGKIVSKIVLGHQDEEIYLYNVVGACFLYRREVLNDVGNYDINLFCVEDYDYWIRVKKKYGKIKKINQVLYKYREHENSLTFSQKEKIRLALIDMRKKHLDFILDQLKEKKDLLYYFYYEMLEKQTLDVEIKEKVFHVLPELKNDVLGRRGKYIIFGAGKYGEKAFQELEKDDKVVFFADNNPDKVGKYKKGKKILSFKKMISLSDQYDILIAIYCGNIYQLVCQLSESGIKQYSTLQTYLSKSL